MFWVKFVITKKLRLLMITGYHHQVVKFVILNQKWLEFRDPGNSDWWTLKGIFGQNLILWFS